ncbi:DUF6522 family protein [Aurantimonas sp. VKM B-3413]|uniref:DUF6522 family protein n=1 Tax=Aurantimonas sp. VKM B-3413 TaxID=2779401 RepID=UPI001E284169|nr:DUF6522 family protein [Aurantimonas sp. VKM B-3413]MCB8836330.1 DUF6522 family protein [Aurantimonas sp. VKM B-3413]
MKPVADMVRDTAGEDAAPAADHDLEVDGVQVAEAFGVPAAFFLAEMRRGNVHGKVERGIGADAGRHRLSFRYRGRTLTFIRHPDGRLRPDDGPAHPG